MASTSRMWLKNLFPSPSPFDAPLTSPAISTNLSVVYIFFSDLSMPARMSMRGSGTSTIPMFGSIVVKGKFSADTLEDVNALNMVDLPTFGNPTMPQLNPIYTAFALFTNSIAFCRSPLMNIVSPSAIVSKSPSRSCISCAPNFDNT